MKKVLKFNATTEFDEQFNKPYVNLTFQTYKDGKQNFGGHVIIYRREEPNYIFDYDEGEYFDCLLPNEKDIIFDGELNIVNTFSEYKDYDVEVGKVYAYWVGRESYGKYLTGPVPIKIRNLNVWWHYDKIIQTLNQLQSKHTNVTVKTVGFTRLGKQLNYVKIGSSENTIACVGAIHAGESGPEFLLTLAKQLLTENPQIFDKCSLAIMPVVNADMREKMVSGTPWYIRTNASGVDLNRNFDANFYNVNYSYNLASDDYRCPTYRGPYPNSEPETQAVINFIKQTNPKIVFSYHALSSITFDCLLSTSMAKNNVNFNNFLDEIYKIYSNAFRSAINYPTLSEFKTSLTCSAGSLPDYLYNLGIPAFDIEAHSDYVDMLIECKTDSTTEDTLALVTKGHKQAISEILNYFNKRN